jgi:hypothetical protein
MKAIAKWLSVEGEINIGDFAKCARGVIGKIERKSESEYFGETLYGDNWQSVKPQKVGLFAVINNLKPGDIIVCNYNGQEYKGEVDEFMVGDPEENFFEFKNNPFYGAHIADDDEWRDAWTVFKKSDGSEIYKIVGEIPKTAKWVKQGDEIEVLGNWKVWNETYLSPPNDPPYPSDRSKVEMIGITVQCPCCEDFK